MQKNIEKNKYGTHLKLKRTLLRIVQILSLIGTAFYVFLIYLWFDGHDEPGLMENFSLSNLIIELSVRAAAFVIATAVLRKEKPKKASRD